MFNPLTNAADNEQNHSPAPLQQPAEQGRRLPAALSVMAFCASYVLTAGPAAFVAKRFDHPSITAIFEVLYAPLIFVVKLKDPILSPLIQAYIRLFR